MARWYLAGCIGLSLAGALAFPVAGHARALDHSGHTVRGKASYYGRHFDGRKMANGKRFYPSENIAASKTLPLGTVAKVTNLANGKSATVTVQDRGPHVDGRVLDVSASVAHKLGMTRQGVVPTTVKPVTVPQPDGSVKLGSGAADVTTKQLQAAVRTTWRLAEEQQ